MRPNKSIKVVNKKDGFKDMVTSLPSQEGREWQGGRPVVAWEEHSTSEGVALAAQAECCPVRI